MKNKICKISLFSAFLAIVSVLPVDANVVKANNAGRSYADAYNQVNAMRYQQELATNASTASATASLPVMVADEKLAAAILNNTSEITVAHLDNCAMIYPNGVFRWEIPESGVRRNQTNQCVAVVSLVDANTNAVLATTTVAAGDSFKCNIDNFPESGMNASALAKTELPADMAPTMEDVEAVMNEEQKQNAGLKIAAGALIAGVAGNLLAKKEAGNTKLFGTGKDQLIGTAAGLATGASVMAASSYTGKVAGDTIKSTAVNAASGMIVGNMLAGATPGDSFLDIQECNIPEGNYKGSHDCIAGKVEEKSDNSIIEPSHIYIVNALKEVKICEPVEGNNNQIKCEPYNKSIVDIELKLENASGSKSFDEIFGVTIKDSEFQFLKKYYQPSASDPYLFEHYSDSQRDNTFYEIDSAYEATNAKRAYIVFQNNVKTLKGYKVTDYAKLIEGKTYKYFNRNNDKTIGAEIPEQNGKTLVFTPQSRNASDGGLIDMSNQARAKGTAVGAAAGGAMGGFAGYQGAKSEITDRWTAAVREYEDSLSNFACMTGTRYLSRYNDYVDIPALNNPE